MKMKGIVFLLTVMVVLLFAMAVVLASVKDYSQQCDMIASVAKLNGNDYPVKWVPNQCMIRLGSVAGKEIWEPLTSDLMKSLEETK